MNDKIKGYIFGIAAAVTYGLNPLFALPLYEDGMNADSVLLFRYLFALPLIAAMIKVRGRNFRIKRNEFPLLILMGILVALSSLMLFESYNYMEAGIASTLLFVYPIFVALAMAIFFKQKINLQTALCILAALCGIALLYKNENDSALSLTGSILVFVSALSYALYIVGINMPALKTLATLKVTFYVLLFGTSLFAGRILYTGNLTVPLHWYMWGNIVALAVFPTAVSFVCTTLAVQYIGSTPTAILGALEPVTAIIIGISVFNEQLCLRELAGLALIILSVTAVITGGDITHVLVRFRKMFPEIRHGK